MSMHVKREWDHRGLEQDSTPYHDVLHEGGLWLCSSCLERDVDVVFQVDMHHTLNRLMSTQMSKVRLRLPLIALLEAIGD